MKKPTQHLIAETRRKRGQVELTIGIDLGDVWSHYCTLNQQGEAIDRGRFRTTPKAIDRWFTDVPHARVAMEAGVHSIWISEQLEKLGHEVIVANVRELRAISHSDRKSDDVDAEKLARYARLDPEILRPISHRTVEQQEALTLIRARELLVRLRTAAVNAVRGLTKAWECTNSPAKPLLWPLPLLLGNPRLGPLTPPQKRASAPGLCLTRSISGRHHSSDAEQPTRHQQEGGRLRSWLKRRASIAYAWPREPGRVPHSCSPTV